MTIIRTTGWNELILTWSGYEKIIDMLVHYDTNPSIKDLNGNSPIDVAIEKGNLHFTRTTNLDDDYFWKCFLGFTEITRVLKTEARALKRGNFSFQNRNYFER